MDVFTERTNSMWYRMFLLLCMTVIIISGFPAGISDDVASAVYGAGVGLMTAVLYHAEVTGPRGES